MAYTRLRTQMEDTIKKWDSLGFLEGLGGYQDIQSLNETPSSEFEYIMFPIVRGVYPMTISDDYFKRLNFKPSNDIKQHKFLD